MQLGRGVIFVLKLSYLTWDSFVPNCGHFCGLWWIPFFSTAPVLLLVSCQEIPSAFSAPDISSHLKQVCVLCGNGSSVVALDIPVLCLLCCFTAHYKAKIPCMTWGHNSKNIIIQRMEAFSFLLITPVVSLPCFCSLAVAAFLICVGFLSTWLSSFQWF